MTTKRRAGLHRIGREYVVAAGRVGHAPSWPGDRRVTLRHGREHHAARTCTDFPLGRLRSLGLVLAAIVGMATQAFGWPVIGGEPEHIEPGLENRSDVLFYGAFASTNWWVLWRAGNPGSNLTVTAEGRDGSGLNVYLQQGLYGATGSGNTALAFLLSATTNDPSYAYHEAMYFRYYIRLDPNFPYVQGGKIPGLMAHATYGAGNHPNGTNGWTARYMWDKCGELFLYAYLPLTNGWGTYLPCDLRGKRAKLLPGKWHCLEQYIQLNTVGSSNGICKTWLDDNLCQFETNLVFRTADSLANKEFGSYFCCFYGGADISWAPPYDTYIRFDNVVLATNYVGPRSGPGVLSAPVITTASGTYTNMVLVSVNGSEGVTIRYTTNGEAPGYHSRVYTGPVRLAQSATFKARAFSNDAPYSPVATAVYSIAPAAITATLTNIATDDSYVWMTVIDPTLCTNNYGNETTIELKASGVGYERRGLVKFSIQSVTNPVVSAKLRLYVQSVTGGPGRITLLETDPNWTNNGVSWANRPDELDLVGTPVTVSAAGWIEWDVTNYLSSRRHYGATELAFYLIMLTDNVSATLCSKEYSVASYRPRLIVSTATADTNPPSWLSGWPTVNNITTNAFTLRAKINEAGTAYYVVLTNNATTPTAAQVKAGQDASGNPALRSGYIALAANAEGTAVITGLVSSTDYDVYLVAEDTWQNLQPAPVRLDVKTASTPIEAWRQTYFGTTQNTGWAADDADPDGDGSVNLLEYALGTVPTNAASAALPLFGIANADGEQYLTLTFQRERAELIYTVLASGNLTNWSGIATNPGSVGQSVTVTDTVPIATAPCRFLRLQVTQP